MSETSQHIPCGHRWEASRVECETLPVLHVCNEQRDEHAYGVQGSQPVPLHACACGATLLGVASTLLPRLEPWQVAIVERLPPPADGPYRSEAYARWRGRRDPKG
jgi:hypothetical protein